MTKAQMVSQLNYITGRIEGIAAGCTAEISSALYDTAEFLSVVTDALLEEDNGEEQEN